MSEPLPDQQPSEPQPETPQQESKTPSIEELSFQQCGNCTTGVLAVVRYDPKALHEAGQDLSASNQQPSGGAYETQCGFCGQRLSHPLGSDSGEGGTN